MFIYVCGLIYKKKTLDELDVTYEPAICMSLGE